LWDCSRTPTSAPFTPRGLPLCPKIFNLHVELEARGLKEAVEMLSVAFVYI